MPAIRATIGCNIVAFKVKVIGLVPLASRPDRKSQSPVSEQQIDDEYDQQNTADTDAAAISPPGIAETAAEEEQQYENDQEQVHPFLR
jgi:hypothetical protein